MYYKIKIKLLNKHWFIIVVVIVCRSGQTASFQQQFTKV